MSASSTQCSRRRQSALIFGRQQLRAFAAFLFLAGMALDTRGGNISGIVQAQGKSGADADALCGKYDSRQFKFVERVNYSEMRDFIVYIDGPLAATSAPPVKPAVVETKRVTQKGALFSPHVLPIVVGTSVEWPNNDEILHNVFSASTPNDFDLGLYKSPKVERWTFRHPGRVDVFCSIHTRMNCIVLVLENPFFAATNDKGGFSIPNVPAGRYKLRAWHERLPSQMKEISVPETGEVKVDFALGITNLPKP